MTIPDYARRRHVVRPDRLGALFGARSIAVVGASASSSWAGNLLRSLDLGGGVERLTFVHPQHDVLFGRPTVPSLRDLPEPADLAFVMVGPHRVEGVLADAAAAGVRNAVVLAAGYGETGEDGREQQRRLAELALELDITVMGPNTIGFINAPGGIAPWAVASSAVPLAGPVGAVFESGSMARATYEFAQAHGIGTSIWASVGNSAVLSSLDVLEYLVEDPGTRAIALFLETVREPARLFELGRRALEADKPVVVFKAGRSEAGKRSAMAHTGALATDDAVVDSAFRQAGIVRVESIEELISTVGLLGYTTRRPQGRRMGVVTSSGGGCNILADLAAVNDVELPPWREATVAALREHLPEFASVLNPLDTTGYGHARARPRPTKAEDDLMEIAVTDPGIDFLFTMMTPLPSEQPSDPAFIESRMKIVGDIVAAAPVPILLSSNTCRDVAEYPRRLLADNGLHLLPGADLAMASIGHMLRWTDQRAGLLAAPAPVDVPRLQARDSTVAAMGTWDEDEGRALLAEAGVPIVPARLVTTADEAADAAAKAGGPVALKICSRDVPHKSDVGGVALNVSGADAAARAFEDVVAACGAAVPDARLRGVLVSPMRAPGPELLVGITVDPTFGPVLAVGLGGVWVEVMEDSALRVLPVSATDVRDMLGELRGAALLRGARGTKPVDLDALSEVILTISRAALSLGGTLQTLEVNPLRISADGIECLDVLVTTEEEQS
ncbi:acetate--CoA ligase family protein [Pseudonocardia petroleophila]|uniref:Acetate--CoA ligase family protein n=1 Tax=Pseudonocardia petroleophila TaxID=37331 RepID=A0A7G7MCH5_9PSEU|nr:acetate--CoA ligase family protein [Pseudonocardia petroleophila]QNG50486.1 acetate--CoA ligase family protein [Pseudonocardia petroleophila]